MSKTDLPNELVRAHLQTEDRCGTEAGSQIQTANTKKAKTTEEQMSRLRLKDEEEQMRSLQQKNDGRTDEETTTEGRRKNR
jgi:bacterioferritin (cytochrome b1)